MQSDNHQPKILVIVGTAREGRVGRKIADWYLEQALESTTGMQFEILDIASLNLPVFNEPVPPMMHQYSEVQQQLAEKIGSADGFVFITGEYNHSIPGSLKNFLDYIYAEWNHKAAAYVGYGGSGGVRAIEHLIQVMTELQVVSVASTFTNVLIPDTRHALDENGYPKDGFVRGNIAMQLKELGWWVEALSIQTAKEANYETA